VAAPEREHQVRTFWRLRPDCRGFLPHDVAAHSGDLERSFRSIMNTDSGDHEHPHEPA
jgi:hypothetical protein